MTASVFSIHNGNLSAEVLRLQEACVRKFLPDNWLFQSFYQPLGGEPHAEGMQRCIELCTTDIIVFLDSDCIPLSKRSFPLLFEGAIQGELIGNIQRSNHLNNNAHTFVAPSCMAFSVSLYRELGSPNLHTTQRGDIGEELSYAWEADGRHVVKLRPTQSRDLIWDLEPGQHKYGHGTVIEDLFYHEFQIRTGGALEAAFIAKCKQVLGS